MELEILTSTSIKAKKPRSSYWWLAENTCAQSVYLLEGTRIETLNLKNGKVQRVSLQIKERSSLMTYGASPNGMYICGVLDSGCIIYRDITSKEGFQVSDSPMSTTELRKSSSKYTHVFISDNSATVMIASGHFLCVGMKSNGEQGYSWSTVDTSAAFESDTGLSKGSAVDAAFVTDDERYHPFWVVLVASTSDDGMKLSVTRIRLQLTRQYPNLPPALETLPSSITIGNSEFPLAAANTPCVVWKKSTYSLESLTGNPSLWSKQKKCYILSLNREGRIAALAVNGRTTSSCKLVFINSASEAVSVHSVYRNTKEHMGRTWWIADMKWTSDGLFVVAITKRGSLLLFPRMSSPIAYSTVGCSLDMGPGTHLCIHRLVVIESTKENIPATHETSSSSERDKLRQLFSVATHPSLPLILCSDGYLATVLQIPSSVTSVYTATQIVQSGLSLLHDNKIITAQAENDTTVSSVHNQLAIRWGSSGMPALGGYNEESKIVPPAVSPVSLVVGSKRCFTATGAIGRDPKSDEETESVIVKCIQLLSSSLALLLSSSHQILTLNHSDPSADALIRSWVDACVVVNKALLLGSAQTLVKFWKGLSSILLLDTDKNHLVMSLSFLSPLLDDIVDLVRSHHQVTVVNCKPSEYTNHVYQHLKLLHTTAHLVVEMIEALDSTYGLFLVEGVSSKVHQVPLPQLACCTEALGNHLEIFLAQAKGTLEQGEYSNEASNDAKRLVTELEKLKCGINSTCSIVGSNTNVKSGSQSNDSLVSMLHRKLENCDIASALEIANSVIHTFENEADLHTSLLSHQVNGEPTCTVGPCSLHLSGCDPDNQAVLCSLGSFMSRYFMQKELLVPVVPSVVTVPLPFLPTSQLTTSFIRIGYEEIAQNVPQECDGGLWSPSRAVELLLLAGRWLEAAMVCQALGRAPLAFSLVASYLHLGFLAQSTSCGTLLVTDATELADTLMDQIILALSATTAQKTICLIKKQQDLISLGRPGYKDEDSDAQELRSSSSLSSALHCFKVCGFTAVPIRLAIHLVESILMSVKRLQSIVPSQCPLPLPIFYTQSKDLEASDETTQSEFKIRQEVTFFFLQFMSILNSDGSLQGIVSMYLNQVMAMYMAATEENIYSKVLGGGVNSSPPPLQLDEMNHKEESHSMDSHLLALVRECFLYLWYLYTRDKASLLVRHSIGSYWSAEVLPVMQEYSVTAKEAACWSIRLLTVVRTAAIDNPEVLEDMVLSFLAELPPNELKASLLAVAFHCGDYEARKDSVGKKFNRIMSELRATSMKGDQNEHSPLSLSYVEAFIRLQTLVKWLRQADLDPNDTTLLTPNMVELDFEYISFVHTLATKLKEFGLLSGEHSSLVQSFACEHELSKCEPDADVWPKLIPLVKYLIEWSNSVQVKNEDSVHMASLPQLQIPTEVVLSALRLTEGKLTSDRDEQVAGPPRSSSQGSEPQEFLDDNDMADGDTQEGSVTLLSIGEVCHATTCNELSRSTNSQVVLTSPQSTSGTTLADDVSKVFHHGSTEHLDCGGEPSGSNELIGSSGIQSCGTGKGGNDSNVGSGGDTRNEDGGDTRDGGDTGDGDGGDTGDGDKSYTEKGGGSGEIRGHGSDGSGSGSSGGESEDDDDHDGKSEDDESDSDSECDSGKKVGDFHSPTHHSTDISPDLKDEQVNRRSQRSSGGDGVSSGTTAKRFITPTKTTMGSSQKHMLPKIPLSSIPNNPHREKSKVKIPFGPPQSTPLDCVDNEECPLTDNPNKVCVTARTAKNTSTSPKLKTADVKTTTEESDSQLPATLDVDELKSPSDMMWPSGLPQKHYDQVTFVNTSQTISSDLVGRPVEAHRELGGKLSPHTRRDMRRIARSEWKKMFNKVSDILKGNHGQWLDPSDASVSEPHQPTAKVTSQHHPSSKSTTVDLQPDLVAVEDLLTDTTSAGRVSRQGGDQLSSKSTNHPQQVKHSNLGTSILPTPQLLLPRQPVSQSTLSQLPHPTVSQPTILQLPPHKPAMQQPAQLRLHNWQHTTPHSARQPVVLPVHSSQIANDTQHPTVAYDTCDSNSLGEMISFTSDTSITSAGITLSKCNNPSKPLQATLHETVVTNASCSGPPIHPHPNQAALHQLSLVEPSVPGHVLYTHTDSHLPQLQLLPPHPDGVPQVRNTGSNQAGTGQKLPLLFLPNEHTDINDRHIMLHINEPDRTQTVNLPLLSLPHPPEPTFQLIHPSVVTSKPPSPQLLQLGDEQSEQSFHFVQLEQAHPLTGRVKHLPQLSFPEKLDELSSKPSFQLLRLDNVMSFNNESSTGKETPPVTSLLSKRDSFKLLNLPLQQLSPQLPQESNVEQDASQGVIVPDGPASEPGGTRIVHEGPTSETVTVSVHSSLSPDSSSSSIAPTTRKNDGRWKKKHVHVNTKDCGTQVVFKDSRPHQTNDKEGRDEKVTRSFNIVEGSVDTSSQVNTEIPPSGPLLGHPPGDSRQASHADLKPVKRVVKEEVGSHLHDQRHKVAESEHLPTAQVVDCRPVTGGTPPQEVEVVGNSPVAMATTLSSPANEFILVKDIEEDEWSNTSDESEATEGTPSTGGDTQTRHTASVRLPEISPVPEPTPSSIGSEADPPGVTDVPGTPKSASLKPASEKENVQEIGVKLDSDHDTVSRLKHVEAQLNALEATARKVRQEIHLDSYELLEALSSRTAVPTTSNHHSVNKEAWSTEVPKDDFTVDYKQHDGVRGQTRGVLAHRRDPIHTAGLKSVAGTRSQLRTRSLPGAPLHQRDRSELRQWMEKKRKETYKRFRKERQSLIQKEKRPFVQKHSRIVLSQGERANRRKELEEEFHEKRVHDAFALMADLVHSHFTETNEPHQTGTDTTRHKGKSKPLRKIASVEGLTEEEADAVAQLLAEVKDDNMQSSNSSSMLTDIDWTAVDRLLDQ